MGKLHPTRVPGAIDLTDRIQIVGSYFRNELIALEAKCLKCAAVFKVETADPDKLEPFVSKHIKECFPKTFVSHEIEKGKVS